jgi:hypothetical protein
MSSSAKLLAERAMEQGHGILRLAPNWVPRSFCVPGRRIGLHPDDYYSFGGNRGGIDERWFSSTTPAANGPLTSLNEGLSNIVMEDGARTEKVLLRDAVSELKDQLIGSRLWNQYQKWPVYSKFFDNQGPLPHHLHHRDEHARLVGQAGKPEAYYFPPQVNNHLGDFPYTFFGLRPTVTREEVRRCMENFEKGDNKITNLSQAYRLEPGTGWDVPPGILHAPGSLCTYEPQVASDVFAMYQSLVMNEQVVPPELLWKDVPPEKVGNCDFLIELLDWEANIDADFAAAHFMRPQPVRPVAEMNADGYQENWICYKSASYSAKELTVFPGTTVTIRDAAAYGLIMLQGHGTLGPWEIETPRLIRFAQLTHDEYFVSERAAREGVKITNPSRADPIVMLKHFGPNNPDVPRRQTSGGSNQ